MSIVEWMALITSIYNLLKIGEKASPHMKGIKVDVIPKAAGIFFTICGGIALLVGSFALVSFANKEVSYPPYVQPQPYPQPYVQPYVPQPNVRPINTKDKWILGPDNKWYPNPYYVPGGGSSTGSTGAADPHDNSIRGAKEEPKKEEPKK